MSSLGAPPVEFLSIGRNLSRLAAEKPDAPALTVDGQTLTFGQLHTRTNRMARGLLAHGAKQGDFVTIALPNSIGFIEAEFACWKIGATPQPVSWRLPAHEMKAIIELANSPLVIGNDASVQAGQARSSHLMHCSPRRRMRAICLTRLRRTGKRRRAAARPAGQS